MLSQYQMTELHEFKGQDAAYVLKQHLKYANIFYGRFEYKCDEDVYSLLKMRLRMALRDEKYVFMRRRLCKNDDKRYYYLKNVNVNRLIVKVDRFDHLHFVRFILQHRYGFCIFIISGTYDVFMYANHQIMDGITIMRAIESICDNPLFDDNLIPKFRHLPVISELISAKCIPHLLTLNHNRSLSVDYDYLSYSPDYTDLSGANGFTGYTGKFSKFTGPISDILEIKNTFQDRNGRKIGFSIIVSAIVTTHYIRHLTKKLSSVNIGIVGAFINPNICNNFGLIVVPIKIKPVIDLFDIVEQIDKCVSVYGVSMMTATYLSTNVYDLNILSNKSVDIVISYVPIIPPLKINGIEYNTKEVVLPCISMPAYTFVFTSNGQYMINSTIITKDIDTNAFSKNHMVKK